MKLTQLKVPLIRILVVVAMILSGSVVYLLADNQCFCTHIPLGETWPRTSTVGLQVSNEKDCTENKPGSKIVAGYYRWPEWVTVYRSTPGVLSNCVYKK